MLARSTERKGTRLEYLRSLRKKGIYQKLKMHTGQGLRCLVRVHIRCVNHGKVEEDKGHGHDDVWMYV